MKIRLTIILVLFSLFRVFAQNDFEDWDKNYKEIDLNAAIEDEQRYADSINKVNPNGDTYARMDLYRFEAAFTGEKRELSGELRNNMKVTYKFFGDKDNLKIFDEVKTEFQFLINGKLYWFAIQPQLENPFINEVEKGKNAYLYCLFLNLHTLKNELYNMLLISEFYAIQGLQEE